MPKGYRVVRVDIADQEKYKAYVAANAEPLRNYGARFLVRGGRFEGVGRRKDVSTIDLIAIEGYEGPEP